MCQQTQLQIRRWFFVGTVTAGLRVKPVAHRECCKRGPKQFWFFRRDCPQSVNLSIPKVRNLDGKQRLGIMMIATSNFLMPCSHRCARSTRLTISASIPQAIPTADFSAICCGKRAAQPSLLLRQLLVRTGSLRQIWFPCQCCMLRAQMIPS